MGSETPTEVTLTLIKGSLIEDFQASQTQAWLSCSWKTKVVLYLTLNQSQMPMPPVFHQLTWKSGLAPPSLTLANPPAS